MKRLLVSFAIAAPAILAQVSGPVLGRFMDSASGRVNTVFGVSGAALFAADGKSAAALGNTSSAAEAAVVLGQNPDTDEIVLRDLTTRADKVLANSAPANTRMALSPSGIAAVYYDSGSGNLVLLWVLNSAKPRSSVLTVSGEPVSLAVSDQGDVMYRLGSAVYVARRGSAPEWLADAPDALFTFAATGTAFLYDRSSSQLSIAKPGTDAALQAQPLDGPIVAGAKFVAVDSKRGSLALATGEGSVSVVSLATGHVQTLACDCAPTRLTRLSSTPVYLLADALNGTVWMLDLNSSKPGIVFAPELKASAE
jgi:hypothetical protein